MGMLELLDSHSLNVLSPRQAAMIVWSGGVAVTLLIALTIIPWSGGWAIYGWLLFNATYGILLIRIVSIAEAEPPPLSRQHHRAERIRRLRAWSNRQEQPQAKNNSDHID